MKRGQEPPRCLKYGTVLETKWILSGYSSLQTHVQPATSSTGSEPRRVSRAHQCQRPGRDDARKQVCCEQYVPQHRKRGSNSVPKLTVHTKHHCSSRQITLTFVWRFERATEFAMLYRKKLSLGITSLREESTSRSGEKQHDRAERRHGNGGSTVFCTPNACRSLHSLMRRTEFCFSIISKRASGS